jgi:hypothetical protein
MDLLGSPMPLLEYLTYGPTSPPGAMGRGRYEEARIEFA